jgi:hypothetical protein
MMMQAGAGNSSTRTAAAPDYACANARRKSVRSAVLDLPFRRDIDFIDENGGGPGGATEQTPVGGHGHPLDRPFLIGLSRKSADISIPIIAT